MPENSKIFESLFNAIVESSSPPILVYQMGKVGSTTVLESLKKAGLPNIVHQVHLLNKEEVDRVGKNYIKTLNSEPYHLLVSRVIHKILAEKKNIRWKIITLVREPVSRDISNFFQNIELLYPKEVNENGKIEKARACELLHKRIESFYEPADYVCTWFDKELREIFQVDVFDHPFNHSDGYRIIHHDNADVLVLRLEDLDRTFGRALKKFLGMDSVVEMVRSNIRKNENYANEYLYVKKNFVVEKTALDKIFSSKYVKHFYTNTMREDFIKKWSSVSSR